MDTPHEVYHGSIERIEGALEPILIQSSEDHVHTQAAVFATENASIACLFMMPKDALFSIGYEQGIAYVCIWGTPEEFTSKDAGGYLYTLPGETFVKRGKAYEWQSDVAVAPTRVERFTSVLEAFKAYHVRAYFITDDALFDQIQAHKDSRLEILRDYEPYRN